MPSPTRNCRGLAADWRTKSAKPSLEVINASRRRDGEGWRKRGQEAVWGEAVVLPPPAGGAHARESGLWRDVLRGGGKARMFPNNEIIADQSEQPSWNTCLTCPQKGKRIELVSGKLGCQKKPKSDLRKWNRGSLQEDCVLLVVIFTPARPGLPGM